MSCNGLSRSGSVVLDGLGCLVCGRIFVFLSVILSVAHSTSGEHVLCGMG